MELNKVKLIFNPTSVLLLFIVVSFLFDFIDKIYIFNDISFIKFNRILKGVFSLYAIGFCIAHFKFFYKKIKFVFITLLLLSIVFLLKGENYNFYKMEFMRYTILFVSFPLLYYVVSISGSKTIANLYKLFKYIIVINAIVILAGVVFDIHIFKTYKANRFGFNGILLSQGFTPFFYLSASILFWYFKDKLMLILTIIAAVLSGVKGVYFAEFLALSLIVFYDSNFSRVFKIRVITIIFLGFTTVTLIILNLSPFKEILKSDGLMAIIFSYRLEYSKELFSHINIDNFNFLIGATSLRKVRLELQLVDIYLFFGTIGVLIYTYFIINLYNTINKNKLAIILFVTALTLSFLIGNLFYIPLSSILICLVLLCLNADLFKMSKNYQ